jgi:osmotically-inducible protein OsmY
MKRITGFLVVSTMAVFAVGCSRTTDNANQTNSNVSNRAVLTNNNQNANTMGVAPINANANSNRGTVPTREEYEKSKAKYESEAKGKGSKIGTGLEDGWLWTKIRYELAAADDLRDSTINVDVDNGVVTLRGTVASPAQKAKAVATAKAVAGVKSVKDELKVSAGGNVNTNTRNANMATANRNANHAVNAVNKK